MSKPESSSEPTPEQELKLLPLRVAMRQHKEGLIGDLELQAVEIATAESLGHKVMPDET